MPPSTLYCFLDTQILIHFATFDEVDWAQKLKVDHVNLALTPSVLRELNKFKDDNTNGPRRRRVRTILPKLERLLEQASAASPVSVRKGVSIFDISKEPQVDWSALGLDPQIEDDRLIASILEFREQQEDAKTVLISDDFLARRKAKNHGILAHDPEGLIEPKELVSADEADRKKLDQELQAYRSRAPKLNLSFTENGATSNKLIRAVGSAAVPWPADTWIEQQLLRKRQEFDRILAQAPADVRERDVADYRRACKEYLSEVKMLLIKERARSCGWRYELAFLLENIGTAPAEDVQISFVFPTGTFVVGTADEYDDYDGFLDMESSNEPVAEWRKVRGRYDFISPPLPYLPVNEPPAREPRPRGPLYDDEDRSRISYAHPKLRNKDTWSLPSVAAYIPPSNTGGFKISYEIRADELLSALTGDLSVVLKP